MKNISQILRALPRLGFRLEYCDGSLVKIYPADRTKPYYSLHVSERATHPLKRFAKKCWGLDITTI